MNNTIQMLVNIKKASITLIIFIFSMVVSTADLNSQAASCTIDNASLQKRVGKCRICNRAIKSKKHVNLIYSDMQAEIPIKITQHLIIAIRWSMMLGPVLVEEPKKQIRKTLGIDK